MLYFCLWSELDEIVCTQYHHSSSQTNGLPYCHHQIGGLPQRPPPSLSNNNPMISQGSNHCRMVPCARGL
jgi:hypothetical protein